MRQPDTGTSDERLDNRAPQSFAISQSEIGEVPSWGPDALVVAPMSGKFHLGDLPDRVEAGEVIGEVRQLRHSREVVSPFSGHTRRLLVGDGHPVSHGQPIVWIVKVA